jgi:hypothetical protein
MSNAPPILTNPGNQTTGVGKSVALQLLGRDPEGKPLTYSATGLPAGLILTSSTGLISGVATTAATSTVTVSASDGVLKTSVTFAWSVTGTTLSAPTLVSPTFTASTTTPTYVWNAVPGAASYLLDVDDARTTRKVWTTVSASAAGCASTTRCSLTPNVALAVGSAKWAVQAILSTGAGAWSNPLGFTVPDLIAPTVAVTSPAGVSDTKNPVLTVAGTASDNVGVTAVTWTNNRGGSGTAAGTAAWTASMALQPGSNVIMVTALDAAGHRSSVTITVIYLVAPVPASPTTSSTTTPTFIWKSAPGATRYVLIAQDSSLAVRVLKTISATDAGCASTTTCTFGSSSIFLSGGASWSVEAVAITDPGLWSATTPFTVGTR